MAPINAYLTIALSCAMGFSIFLSMPLLFRKNVNARQIMFLNAVAVGILVFLLMDIYGNVAILFGSTILPNGLELTFIAAFVVSFLFFILPKSSRDPDERPKRTSILAAIGIGFQNLTEGMVFGSAGAAGLGSIYLISLLGFTLQNLTEGFPIAAPLMAAKEKLQKRFVVGAFLIGGMPTIIGTAIGLVYYSATFIVFFDALASAAILYIVLVLFHVNVKRALPRDSDKTVYLTYMGILLGFVLAYIVNYL